MYCVGLACDGKNIGAFVIRTDIMRLCPISISSISSGGCGGCGGTLDLKHHQSSGQHTLYLKLYHQLLYKIIS